MSSGAGISSTQVANNSGLTDTQLRASAVATSNSNLSLRYGGGKLYWSSKISAAGNNLFKAPSAGKIMQVVWVSIVPNVTNTNGNLVKVKFGPSGVPFYMSYVNSHWEPFAGAVDEALYVETETADPVAVTIHYLEL